MAIAPAIIIDTPVVLPGGERRVNTTTAGEQTAPVIAALSDGGYIVAWSSAQPDGTFGVYTQRYDAFGAARGAETFVNLGSSGFLAQPSVAELSTGGYAVAYASEGPDRDGSNTGIYLQRYNDAGIPLGDEIQVNGYTTDVQSQPTVVGLHMGVFAVVWMSSGQDGSGDGIYTRRYSDSGVPLETEKRVNSFTAGAQYDPAAVDSASASYVVVWSSQGQDGSGDGIYSQAYNSEGTAISDEVRVNSFTAADQFAPAVAELFPNDYVVAWVSQDQDGDGYGIYAQRFNSSGPLGSETRVNTVTTNLQTAPAVAGLSDGGYLVTWSSLDQDGDSWGIYSQRFDRDGVAVGSETRLNTTTAGAQQSPTVAGLTGGGYVVAWQSDQQDGSGNGIYHALHDNDVLPATEQVTLDLRGTLSIEDADAGDTVMTLILKVGYGRLDVTVGDSGATWAGGTASFAVLNGTLAQLNALLGSAGTSTLAYTPDSDAPPGGATLFLDVRDGTNNVAFATATIAIGAVDDEPTVTFAPPALAPQGEQTLIGTLDGLYAGGASIGALDDGTYLVAWTSEEVATYITPGIRAQLFSADGAALGSEFAVNTFTDTSQTDPSVAAAGDAGFVVAWASSDQDGLGLGIFAQRFDPEGDKTGAEFQVNTHTPGDQFEPAVAMADDGSFVVSWTSYNQVGPYGVFAQRFAADGSAQGGEFAVESQVGVQRGSDIAMLSGGWTLVTWTSEQYNGNAEDIYGQMFESDGTRFGSAFLVNSGTAGAQRNAAVAAIDGPNYFVVTWESSDGGIYGQRVNSAGLRLGAEFRIDNPAGGPAVKPSVAPSIDGGFVVTWSGTHARKYDVNGNPLGTEFLVGSGGTASNADIAAAGSGFVVGWQSHGVDGSGVYTQLLTPIYSVVQGPLDLKGTLSVADPDAGDGVLTATLSVAEGVLEVDPGDSGATIDAGNETASVTLSGTLTQLNALFGPAGTSTLAFIPPGDGAPDAITLTLSVNDNGNTGSGGPLTSSASATIALVAVNNPPVVAGLAGDAATYTEGGGAVRLDVGGNTTITDADSDDFGGGRLTIDVLAPGEDVFSVVHQGNGAGQIGVNESEITFGGTRIGTYASGGPGQLTVQFDANATPAAVQALVRNIAYTNTESEDPTAGVRTVSWVLVDGDGTDNGGDQDMSFTSTVVVVAVDDAPVARPDAVTTAENAVAAGNLFADNGFGPDFDVDGPVLLVSAVEGLAANVGEEITLASGAGLTLDANGNYLYAPNDQFDCLVSAATGAATGAVNTSATDSFSYTLAGGNSVTVTVTITGADGPGDQLRGGEGDDILYGGPGVDQLLGAAGNDHLDGGTGADTMTGGLGDDVFIVDNSGDVVIEAGGQGSDTLYVYAPYVLPPGIETVYLGFG